MKKLIDKLKDIDVKTCLGIIAFLGAFMLISCAVFWSACAVQYAKADVTTWDLNTWYYIDTSNTWYNPTDTQQVSAPGLRVYLSENGAEPSANVNGVSASTIRFMNGYGIWFWTTGSSTTADKYGQWQNSVPSYTPPASISTSYPNGRIYFKFTTSLPSSTILDRLATYSTSTVVPSPVLDYNNYAVVPLVSSYWVNVADIENVIGVIGANVTNAGGYRITHNNNPYTVRVNVTYKHTDRSLNHSDVVLLANIGTNSDMKYYFVPFDMYPDDLYEIDLFFSDDTLPAPVTVITDSDFLDSAYHNYITVANMILSSDIYLQDIQSQVTAAYNLGYEAGYTEQNNLIAVMWESFSLPVRLLFGEWQVDSENGVGQYVGGLFNFTILGVDVRAFVLAILTILILVSIVKFILGLRR